MDLLDTIPDLRSDSFPWFETMSDEEVVESGTGSGSPVLWGIDEGAGFSCDWGSSDADSDAFIGWVRMGFKDEVSVVTCKYKNYW